MAEAAFWGFFGGLALVIGAVVAPRVRDDLVPYVMAFGAGVLVSAVAFDLTEEALEIGGADATALGLVAGSLAFIVGDFLIDRRSSRRREGEGDPEGIVLGAVLDGIPESAAIGLTLLGAGGVSASFVTAVFLSNLPESISASKGLRPRHPTSWIVRLWLLVAAASAAAAALGYLAMDGASEGLIAGIKAFAAGAILTMLSDSMIPEAFREGGRKVGLVTVLGFALAAVLSTA